jgi:predicted metal-dependent hydrolase
MDDPLEQWLEACAAYQREVALAHLDTPLGEARELRLSEALERAIDVWPASELADLGSLIEEAPAAQQDALRRVRAWGVSMYLQGAMLPPRREMLARQRSLTCRVDDEVIPVM